MKALLFVAIYLFGMFIGFLVSAYKKGRGKNDWWHGELDSWSNHTDRHVPVLVTFFWWICLPGAIAWWILDKMYACFLVGLDKTNKTMSDLNERKSSAKVRRRIASPSPSVKEAYRAAGPKPCIACGSPTSVDQSDMEVVCMESWEAKASRLDL